MVLISGIASNFNMTFRNGKLLEKIDNKIIEKFLSESNDELQAVYKAKLIFDKNEKKINKLIKDLYSLYTELHKCFVSNVVFSLEINKKIFSNEGILEINKINEDHKYFKIYEKVLETAVKLVEGDLKHCETDSYFGQIEAMKVPDDIIERSTGLKKKSIGENLKKFVTDNYNLKQKYKDLPYWNLKLKFEEGAYTSAHIEDLYEICHFRIPRKITTSEVSEFEKNQKKYIQRAERELRKRLRGEHLQSTNAYIYVLSNKSYPNTYKIGSTTGTPEDRAIELSTTGVIYPFKVEYKEKFKNVEFVEKKVIHKIFDRYRLKSNREFFEINLKSLKKIIKIVKQNEKDIHKKDFVKKIKIDNQDLIG